MEESHRVSLQQARAIASKAARDTKPDADFVIEDELTVERDFGWVFFYAPNRYLQTGDYSYLVPGAGPLVVLREDGSTYFLPTALSAEVSIDGFEKKWRARKHK